jgi:hypothetical protein
MPHRAIAVLKIAVFKVTVLDKRVLYGRHFEIFHWGLTRSMQRSFFLSPAACVFHSLPNLSVVLLLLHYNRVTRTVLQYTFSFYFACTFFLVSIDPPFGFPSKAL